MGYQVNPVDAYWVLEDTVGQAAAGMCHTCAFLSVFLQALQG